MAGGWTAVVNALAGTREHQHHLEFTPPLPDGIERIAFRLVFRGRKLRVDITPKAATYELLTGAPLVIHHWGTPLTTQSGAPASAPVPPPRRIPALRQPPGRAPERRRLSATVPVRSRVP